MYLTWQFVSGEAGSGQSASHQHERLSVVGWLHLTTLGQLAQDAITVVAHKGRILLAAFWTA
jgi:hypothetical protein